MHNKHIDLQRVLQHGLYIISGNHRRFALADLRKKFDKNPLYANIPCLILACAETEENKVQLRRLGSAYNDVDHHTHPVSFKDKMFQLRTEWELTDRVISDADKKTKRRKIKEAYSVIWGIAMPTMGSHISMIRKPAAQWELIARYLRGEHLAKSQAPTKSGQKRKRGAEVKSWGALIQTTGLNEDNFSILMNDVLGCTLKVSHQEDAGRPACEGLVDG